MDFSAQTKMQVMPINGFSNYTISSSGIVSNIKTGNTDIGSVTADGYKQVCLTQDGKKRRVFIHRLVAEHFMKPDPELCYCDHKDRNKLNNDVSNLEWASGSLNAKNCKNRGEYVTTLPEGAVEFVEYKSYKFADYFIHKCDDVKQMYLKVRNEYRKLPISKNMGYPVFHMTSIEHKPASVRIELI